MGEATDKRDRWGGWVGTNHPDKGKADGRCNRTACQRDLRLEPEHQFMDGNSTGGPRLYYCAYCALKFDRVDEENRVRGASSLPNRILREPKRSPVESGLPGRQGSEANTSEGNLPPDEQEPSPSAAQSVAGGEG